MAAPPKRALSSAIVGGDAIPTHGSVRDRARALKFTSSPSHGLGPSRAGDTTRRAPRQPQPRRLPAHLRADEPPRTAPHGGSERGLPHTRKRSGRLGQFPQVRVPGSDTGKSTFSGDGLDLGEARLLLPRGLSTAPPFAFVGSTCSATGFGLTLSTAASFA